MFFFFSSRRRHTRCGRDWSSDVCSSDLSEALGVCFLDKGAYVVAESILRRALDLPASGDQERLGVLYWLGRALEEQGKRVEARDLYGRVFAVDIRFRDVRERAKALAKAK